MALQLDEIRQYVAPSKSLDEIRNADKKKRQDFDDMVDRIWHANCQKAHNYVRSDLHDGKLRSWMPVYQWIHEYNGNWSFSEYDEIMDALFTRIRKEFGPLHAKFHEDVSDGLMEIDFSHLNPEKADARDRESTQRFLSFFLGSVGALISVLIGSTWVCKQYLT